VEEATKSAKGREEFLNRRSGNRGIAEASRVFLISPACPFQPSRCLASRFPAFRRRCRRLFLTPFGAFAHLRSDAAPAIVAAAHRVASFFVSAMKYRPYENLLAPSYDQRAEQYRHDDEIEARSENHRRLGGNLRRICRSFPQPIRVLEIGCGTGRYFHWLENVALLVGTDISAEMLRRAEHPVLQQEITAREIRLVRGSVYEMEFEPGVFDFIYSLGVFGYGAAVTPELCARLHRWLAPGGRVYFDAIEIPHRATRKDRLREWVYPRLPSGLRQRLDARQAVPVVRHAREEVRAAMLSAGFSDVVLASNRCHSPLWNGVHLECSGGKPALAASAPHAASVQLEFATAH
jgi:SAM-dependent methyltransferase